MWDVFPSMSSNPVPVPLESVASIEYITSVIVREFSTSVTVALDEPLGERTVGFTASVLVGSSSTVTS